MRSSVALFPNVSSSVSGADILFGEPQVSGWFSMRPSSVAWSQEKDFSSSEICSGIYANRFFTWSSNVSVLHNRSFSVGVYLWFKLYCASHSFLVFEWGHSIRLRLRPPETLFFSRKHIAHVYGFTSCEWKTLSSLATLRSEYQLHAFRIFVFQIMLYESSRRKPGWRFTAGTEFRMTQIWIFRVFEWNLKMCRNMPGKQQ